MIPIDLQNKLKLNKEDEFIWIENPKDTARLGCKYDKILYCPKEEDEESDILDSLLKLCRKDSLILIADIPQTNKRLSNGVEKYNKDIFAELIEEKNIKKYWFLKSHKENCLELLIQYA